MTAYGRLAKFFIWFLRVFSQTVKVEGAPDIEGPVLYIGRHLNNYGPIAMYLHMPATFRLWAFDLFTQSKSCYRHLRDYTFSKRKRFPKWLAMCLSRIISHPAAALLKSLRVIPVHRSSRKITETIEETLCALQNKENIMILTDRDYMNISENVGNLYGGFVTLARRYQRRTGKNLPIVPVCIHRAEHILSLGPPLYLDADLPFPAEKARLIASMQAVLNGSF